MPAGETLSPAQVDEIITRTIAGESTLSIAAGMGLPAGTVGGRVTRWRRANAISPLRHVISADEFEIIDKLLDAGETIEAIAVDAGVARTTISRRVNWRKTQGWARPDRESHRRYDVDEVISRVLAGESRRSIAALFGVHKSVIEREVKGILGPSLPRSVRTAGAEARVVDLTQQGMTATEIASDTGLSRATISRIIGDHRRQHGTASLPRPVGRRPKSVPTERLIEMLEMGVPQCQIAKIFEIDQSTVSKRISAWCATTGRPNPCSRIFTKIAPETAAQIAELISQGARYVDVVATTGVSKVTVRRHAKGAPRAAWEACRVERNLATLEVTIGRALSCMASAHHRRRTARADKVRELQFVSSQSRSAQRDDLYARIAAQVPAWITGATRDDIISDAYIAAMERGL